MEEESGVGPQPTGLDNDRQTGDIQGPAEPTQSSEIVVRRKRVRH